VELYNAAQIKKWDAYTIENEPISSIDLMERAATKCTEWIITNGFHQLSFKIFCGKGNNGGDGLAIARLLHNKDVVVEVYILEFGKLGSEDFQINLHRLHELPIPIHFLQSADQLPQLKDEVVIDALYGSGLNKPLDGLSAEVVHHINEHAVEVIAIDIPSGLFMDASSKNNISIVARHTLTFQTYKLAFLVAENNKNVGQLHILDIGLHPLFLQQEPASKFTLDETFIKSIYKSRKKNPFAHKGTFGHSLLICGSYGKMGAAVLAAKACLKSGAGLLTCFIPSVGYNIMQTALPEAMVITDDHENILANLPSHIETYSAIGIGPGIGTAVETQKLFSFLVRRSDKPVVIDADGLNCLSLDTSLLSQLPPNSILTPHPKEFDRLFGEYDSDFDRIKTAETKSKELHIIIVLKGHHTLITTPGGISFFNTTGNAGLAKGGSGDVLTGIITALLSQGYEPAHAALLGVYLHGLSADIAAKEIALESMMPSDIIENISAAYKKIEV
jgi:ADP-dependent NAD(P)H-hydrate dehydratase / NAD(P)H-hydrate epimerase